MCHFLFQPPHVHSFFLSSFPSNFYYGKSWPNLLGQWGYILQSVVYSNPKFSPPTPPQLTYIQQKKKLVEMLSIFH